MAAINPFATTAGSIGLGTSALGLLGASGLFGGAGTVTNPYSGQADQAYGQANGALGSATGAGLDLTNTGHQALGQYQDFQPTSNAATSDYLNYLKQNPYTDTFSQAKLAQNTSGALQGFAQARAHLATSLGQRGIASPGGASSEYAGGMAGIDASQASTLANNQNGLALESIEERRRRLLEAQRVAEQHSGILFGQGTGATQTGSGILGNVANGYNNLGNSYLNEGQQQIMNTQGANNAASDSWTGLASLGMKVAGL